MARETSQLRNALRRPTVETLEDRRLMAIVPYSDGLYYPAIGKLTAYLPEGLSPAEYARRSDLTNGRAGSGDGNLAEGMANVAALNAIEVEPNDFPRNAQVLPLGTVAGRNQLVNVAGTMTQIVNVFDEDFYALDLRAGDILDLELSGLAIVPFELSINDANNRFIIGSNSSWTTFIGISPFPAKLAAFFR